MRYTQYGRTGKKVSAVGFGGMRFDTDLSLDENAELVRYAASKGITYFDTAPGYCKDLSEDIYGLAFQDMPGEFLVSTKGMPTTFDTASKARKAVETSLKRLKVPKIHFYHIWCLRHLDHFKLAMKKGGQYEGLLKCREEGLIDHIVCSSHQPGKDIRTVVDSGAVEGVLMGINILNFPYRWDGVLACNEKKLGVVAMNPLGGGTIPQNPKLLAFLSQGGETPVEAALRFNIACPQITISLVGFTTREHVDMACRVADEAAPMSEKELDRLRGHLSKNMDAVCTGCGYCEGCPEDIPIPGYMQVYNEKQMFGKSDADMKKSLSGAYQWGNLNGHKGAAARCVECGQCEEKCTQHINIIERLREIDAWDRA
jgi:predicted aldo/keto reductase-like oxidoreductase